MIQGQLRFQDGEGKEEVRPIPLDKVPMIPRVGEIVILQEDSGDSVKLEVTAVRHEYVFSPALDVEAASVVLTVKRRNQPNYPLITFMQKEAKDR